VSTYEPTYLLTLTWGGRTWRLCTGDIDVRVDRGTGLSETFSPGLSEAPGWEEVVDPLQQVPDGATATLDADLGVDEDGTGWPSRLSAAGHRHLRARATLEVLIGGVAEVLLFQARIEQAVWGAPDQPPGWVAISLSGAALPAGVPLADPSAVVGPDALTLPALDYEYSATGQLMATIYGRPGLHRAAAGLTYTPAAPAWAAVVILGLDTRRLIMGADPSYSGLVRVYDAAGSFEDLPVEDWADADGRRWPTVDISGSTVLDLQSTEWSAAWLDGATTAPDSWRGGDLGQLGPLLTWALCSLGLSVHPLPGDAWERIEVAWVADSADGTALDFLVDALLPCWPLALVRRGREVRLLPLAPSSWPAHPPPLVVGTDCEAVGGVQTVGAVADLASHIQVAYGLDLDAAPLGLVEVELPGAELELGERRVAERALPAVISRADAQTSAGAWGEVIYRPWLALEVLLPFSIRPPRAGDVRLLTDARVGGARRALVSIVRAEVHGWSLTLLVPA
jgi:hypothetical protein